jgi:hypothetical protein
MHSLGVSKHPTMIQGEIDFVVIIPEEGVLCLEVKAGNVRREQGIWRYGSEPFAETSVKGPFKQASEGMHAIREYIKRTDPSLRSILFFSGVLFTYIDFDEVSTEWHPWQYADRSILSRVPISICCLNMLRKAHEHVQNSSSAKSWYDPIKSRPSQDQVELLVNILRGDFEYFVKERVTIEETEREILHFTEEQFSALDVLEENYRIVFKGPAGTGKTLLAIEAAKRSVSAGRKSLLLCYNKLLGQWLVDQVKPFAQKYPDLLTAGTLHKFLLKLSALRSPDLANSNFWLKKVPLTVIDRALLGVIRVPLCEMLIIDEAQDLITEEYLDVLDLLLQGGLAGGQWAMFGDFERQSIYTRKELDGELNIPEMIRRRSPTHFYYPLRINCRNAEPIAVGIELVCKLQPGYTRILQGKGADVDISFYRTAREQITLLQNKLESLKENFLPSEIVVLSTRDDNSSCAGIIWHEDPSLKFKPIRTEGENKTSIGFTTIQAFKGMESPAIILTDVEKITGERAESLLYIGMSRARQKLVILMNENCRDAYMKALKDGFLSSRVKGRS